MSSSVFSFPSTVNEITARIVATGVVLQAVAFLATGWGWLLIPLVYGFAARVLTGPTASLLGQFAVRVVTPLVPGSHRLVPGPPKRFAQMVGLAFSGTAGLAWLAGVDLVAKIVIVGLVAAAGLEAALGVCFGCIVYNRIWGCADCDDLGSRLLARTVARASSQSTVTPVS